MNAIITTILSIILMIGLGYLLKRIDFLSESAVDPFNKIVMYIFLPCLIFSSLYSADLSGIDKLCVLPLVIIASSLVTGCISYIILKQLHFDDKKLWSVLVTVMIANTGFMGYPVNLGIYGEAGLLRAIFCDIATSLTFLVLSSVLVLKFGGTFKKAIRTIVLFPTLWAVILGILFNLFNIPLWPVLDNTISYLGQGAIPLIMISMGLTINLEGLLRSKSMIVFTSVMKLVFFPLIAFIIVTQLGFVNLEHNVPIVQAAMPSGMMSLLLSVTYKLDYELSSDCILTNTVISLITLPVIIMFL